MYAEELKYQDAIQKCEKTGQQPLSSIKKPPYVSNCASCASNNTVRLAFYPKPNSYHILSTPVSRSVNEGRRYARLYPLHACLVKRERRPQVCSTLDTAGRLLLLHIFRTPGVKHPQLLSFPLLLFVPHYPPPPLLPRWLLVHFFIYRTFVCVDYKSSDYSNIFRQPPRGGVVPVKTRSDSPVLGFHPAGFG